MHHSPISPDRRSGGLTAVFAHSRAPAWYMAGEGLTALASYALLIALVLALSPLAISKQPQRIFSGAALPGYCLVVLSAALLAVSIAELGFYRRSTLRKVLAAGTLSSLCPLLVAVPLAALTAGFAQTTALHSLLVLTVELMIALDAGTALVLLLPYLAPVARGTRGRAVLGRGLLLAALGLVATFAASVGLPPGRWLVAAVSPDPRFAACGTAVALAIYGIAVWVDRRSSPFSAEERKRLAELRERYRSGGLDP